MDHEINLRWVQGWQFVGADSKGHTLVLDSPSLGEGAGLEPMGLLLFGLAGCMGMDVISILKKKQQKVVQFEMRVGGDRRPDPPRAWVRMHIELIVRGHQIDPAAVERAVELSETKYCSVYATLTPTVQITRSIKIEELE
jgi:putative redox protein